MGAMDKRRLIQDRVIHFEGEARRAFAHGKPCQEAIMRRLAADAREDLAAFDLRQPQPF